MKRQRAFTVLEIVVVLVIIGCALLFGVLMYRNHIEKAKSAEAIITAGMIRNAEEVHKIETGTYVAAENTSDVNKNLNMGIVPKDYEYRVVGVTDDNFVVIAERIGKDIASGSLIPAPIVVAMDKTGAVSGGYKPPPVTNDAPAGSGGGSGAGGGAGGGGRTSGGGGDIQGGGGGGAGFSGNSGDTGGDTRSGGSQADFYFNSDLMTSLGHLEGTDSADELYQLIIDENVSVAYKDFVSLLGSSTTLGLYIPSYWIDIYPEYEGKVNPNTIYINQLLQTSMSEQEIAAIITHEALHADYCFNQPEWVAAAMARHGVAESELSWYLDPETNEKVVDSATGYFIWEDSIEQEYNCFVREAQFWEETKGDLVNAELDGIQDLYEQDDHTGTDTELWKTIAATYAGYPIY